VLSVPPWQFSFRASEKFKIQISHGGTEDAEKCNEKIPYSPCLRGNLLFAPAKTQNTSQPKFGICNFLLNYVKNIIMKKFSFFAILLAGFIFLLSSCENYGKKVEVEGTQAEVYYKDGATETDAKNVGEYFKKQGMFTKDKRASAQVVKSGDKYIVRLVYNKEFFDKTPGVEEAFKLASADISKEFFGGKPVDIALADNHMKDFKLIPYDPNMANAFDPNDASTFKQEDFDHDSEGGMDFFWKGITDDESKKIADYLVQTGSFAGGKAQIFMTKSGDKTILRYPVKEGVANDPTYLSNIEKLAKDIKDNLFPNSPFSFQLTDKDLKTVKSFDY